MTRTRTKCDRTTAIHEPRTVHAFCRLICLLLLLCSTSVHADEFPREANGQTEIQLQTLMDRAATEEMIPAELRIRQSGNRILFDVSFKPNTDRRSWVILVNQTDDQLTVIARDLRRQGYEPLLEQSIRSGRQTRHTIVWVRSNTEPKVLVLPSQPTPESGIEDNRLRTIDEFFREFIRVHNVAGVSVAIAKDERLVYSRGFGYADVQQKTPISPGARMRIASVSKPMTAVMTMILVQQKKLTLDTPIVPILTQNGFPPLSENADSRWNRITVRHLLQHSGGWDSGSTFDPMFDVVRIARQERLQRPVTDRDIIKTQMRLPLSFSPGTASVYSNFGYCLLGRIIEAVTKQNYADCMAENILKPCHMNHTSLGKTRSEDRQPAEVRYHMQRTTTAVPFWAATQRRRRTRRLELEAPVESPYGQWDLEVMDANGGWLSSAADLLRFVRGLSHGDAPLLDEAHRSLMLQRPEFQEYGGSWYGCGWYVRTARPADSELPALSRCNIRHNGALDGTSALLVRRWDGLSCAVLFNTDFSINNERLSDLVEPPLQRIMDHVEFWPDYDLFRDEVSP